MSTSKAELDGALGRAMHAARDAGFDVQGWALHGGSAANGVSFRLDTGGRRLVHLGFTRTEAWRCLSAMADAWEMVPW